MYKQRFSFQFAPFPSFERKVEQFKGSDLVINEYGNPMNDISRLMRVGSEQSISQMQFQKIEDKSLGRSDREKCTYVRSRYCDLPKERIEYEDAIMEQYANTLQSEQRAELGPGTSEEQPNVSSEGA